MKITMVKAYYGNSKFAFLTSRVTSALDLNMDLPLCWQVWAELQNVNNIVQDVFISFNDFLKVICTTSHRCLELQFRRVLYKTPLTHDNSILTKV